MESIHMHVLVTICIEWCQLLTIYFEFVWKIEHWQQLFPERKNLSLLLSVHPTVYRSTSLYYCSWRNCCSDQCSSRASILTRSIIRNQLLTKEHSYWTVLVGLYAWYPMVNSMVIIWIVKNHHNRHRLRRISLVCTRSVYTLVLVSGD